MLLYTYTYRNYYDIFQVGFGIGISAAFLEIEEINLMARATGNVRNKRRIDDASVPVNAICHKRESPPGDSRAGKFQLRFTLN